MRNVLVGIVLALTCGCTLNKQFAQAELATYEAVGPRYVEYTKADPTLSDDDKVTRIRTISEWKATLDEANK